MWIMPEARRLCCVLIREAGDQEKQINQARTVVRSATNGILVSIADNTTS